MYDDVIAMVNRVDLAKGFFVVCMDQHCSNSMCHRGQPHLAFGVDSSNLEVGKIQLGIRDA